LKPNKIEGFVTRSNRQGWDNRIEWRVKTTNHISNKSIINNGLTNSCKLSIKLLSSFNIISATLRALMQTLKLALKMKNLGLGMRSKPTGEWVPDLLSAGDTKGGRHHFLFESSIKPRKNKLIFLSPK
jgi:hypothetical protein